MKYSAKNWVHANCARGFNPRTPRVICTLLLGFILVSGLAVLAPPVHGEPAAARQDELIYRLRHDCGSCHGMTLKGGLGPPLVPAEIAETEDAHLINVILQGIEGTPMPPWAFEISHDEAAWLVRQLKRGIGNEF